MRRTDSAFDGTFCPKDLGIEISPVDKSNTATIRVQPSRKSPPNLPSAFESPLVDAPRPSSERRSTTRRKADARRKSITSSSSDSNTKESRRRGHGSSLPSSRRTSCTIVDPSRPARHYRIKSSQTCPTVNRDVDDVLALHFRSCSLFQNPSYHSSNLPSPTISGYGAPAGTDFDSMQSRRSETASPSKTDNVKPSSPKESEETIAQADTTMHWMSPSTRRTQYEKIDRANSGLRGFIRKMVPRSVSGPPAQRFYETDKSDAGSVRRFRMDVEDEEEHNDEKSISALKQQHHKLARSTTQKTDTKTKRWGCF